MSLEEALGQLTEFEATDIAKGLQSHAHSAWQAIFNEGHKSGSDSKRRELETAEKSLATATADLETASSKITEMEGKQPDLASIREQHALEITDLKGKQKAELQGRDQSIHQERLRNARNRLAQELEHECGIDPDYASEVLVAKDDVSRRLTFDEDGSLRVLQLGKDIEIQPTEDKSAISLLADEVAKGVNPKWIVSRVDRGTETRGTRTTGGVKGGAALYDSIRERAKAAHEVKSVDRRATLEQRLGRA